MNTDAWNPEQYQRFKAQRAQPFYDLVAMLAVQKNPRVIDLGCGTGELTAHLHKHVGAIETVGLESSGAMLAEAASFRAPRLRFVEGDIGGPLEHEAFDLVFSNAALHWLPDHPSLFERLHSLLNAHGQFAVQVPANHDHISQTHAAILAATEPFRGWLSGFSRESPVMSPTEYALLLKRIGFVDIQVTQRVYLHELPSRHSVVEWVRGTTLTDYEKRLTAPQYEEFMDSYRVSLTALLADEQPYVFPFKRIFMIARKTGLLTPSN